MCAYILYVTSGKKRLCEKHLPSCVNREKNRHNGFISDEPYEILLHYLDQRLSKNNVYRKFTSLHWQIINRMCKDHLYREVCALDKENMKGNIYGIKNSRISLNITSRNCDLLTTEHEILATSCLMKEKRVCSRNLLTEMKYIANNDNRVLSTLVTFVPSRSNLWPRGALRYMRNYKFAL